MRVCSIPKCPSKSRQSTSKIPVFRFPSDPLRRRLWEEAVPVSNFVAKKTAGICKLHFREDDFQAERSDRSLARQQKRGPLKVRKIKKLAIPSIWPELLRIHRKPFVKEPLFDSLTDLRNHLDKLELPSGVFFWDKGEEHVAFCLIEMDETFKAQVGFNVTVMNDMTYQVFIKGESVPLDIFHHVCKGRIQTNLHVGSLLNSVKHQYEVTKTMAAYAPPILPPAPSTFIKSAVENLQRFLERSHECDPLWHNKIAFLSEQLELVTGSRKYSNSLIATSMGWYQRSPALYQQISTDDILSLPCARHLRKVRTSLTVPPASRDHEFCKVVGIPNPKK